MRKTHHCTNKNTRTKVALLHCTCVAALAEIPACEARSQSSPARRGCSFEWSPAMSVTSQKREKHDASSAYYIHSPPLDLLLVSVAAAVVAAPSAAVAVVVVVVEFTRRTSILTQTLKVKLGFMVLQGCLQFGWSFHQGQVCKGLAKVTIWEATVQAGFWPAFHTGYEPHRDLGETGL